ncbi:Beta-N-acetylglucosaminidase [Clostridium sp. USBA 49]|uniref:DUF4214 domain-containing protein n=1 Tax=Clostridium sp. USBA 49 TaxID=1881060 RepID=UPI00099A2009|nr:DUF4214 domain-containing protein [Clostridium sp. USBA 49]SKA87576.1 Beta-N-acetylglucosaminidase [Clostridium sp. USBA 49]
MNNFKRLKLFILIFTFLLFSNFFNINTVYASESTDKFITRLYRTMLNREPDLDGLKFWSYRLETKDSASDIVKSFFESEEFRNRKLTDEEYVSMLYKSILGRNYDKEGLAAWIKNLNSGYSRLRVLTEFLNSPEFSNQCVELGIKKGTIFLTDPIDIRPDAVNFITSLYKNALNRVPDDNGLRFYVSVIANNKITGSALAEAFLLCPEFINRNVSNDEFIKIIYKSFYNREPNEIDLKSWTNLLNNGYTRRRLIASIVYTDEFKNNITKYKISVGNIELKEAIDRRPDLVQFVTRLYNQIYNRQPDLDGLKYHVSRLDSKKITAAEFIESFIFTTEFKNNKLNYNDYINMLYRSIYGREADSSGKSYWLDKLNNGYSKRWVLAGFVNSDEFQQLSNKYGLNKGQIITNGNDILKPIISIDNPISGFIMKNDLNINGWAINPSGIKTINIYIDEKFFSSTTVSNSREDIGKLYSDYPNAENSGYSYILKFDSISIGPHKLTIQAIGNNGTKTEQSVNFQKGNAYVTYTNYPIAFDDFVNKQIGNTPALQVKNANGIYELRYAITQNGQQGYYIKVYKKNPDGSIEKDENGNNKTEDIFFNNPAQYNAIKQEIINKADPITLSKDETQIYQFLKLSYVDGISASDLNDIFNPNGVLNGKGQVFIDAAKAYNVNPVYLAAHAIHETGNGTSDLAKGIIVNGVKVYNLFGIGAVDSNPNGGGAQTAYNNGWDTIDKAIYGGAKWISNGYINAGQDTLYKMRWNPSNPTVHQYATDVKWAYNQAFKYKEIFDSISNIKLVFEIPKFK